jgi:hypothetical protein
MRLALLLAVLGADPGAAELNRIDGYEKAKWGTSEATLEALYPAAVKTQVGAHETYLLPAKRHFGLTGREGFLVLRGKVIGSMILFDDNQPTLAAPQTPCDAILAALTAKYGPPVKNAAGAPSWTGTKTLLALKCVGSPPPPATRVTVVYLSKASVECKAPCKER